MMATLIVVRCHVCYKEFKSFSALEKHMAIEHPRCPLPKIAKFFEGELEVKLPVGENIRSPVVKKEYLTWLAGVVARINAVHHQKCKRRWQAVEFNLVVSKYFCQLLKDLKDPVGHSVRATHHWRPPIMSAKSRKVTYRFFDLESIKGALGKQTQIKLKENIAWSGQSEVAEKSNEAGLSPEEIFARALSKAHGRNCDQQRITCRSRLVVGRGEGRATREFDVIWWPDLYDNSLLGKLCLRFYVQKVEF